MPRKLLVEEIAKKTWHLKRTLYHYHFTINLHVVNVSELNVNPLVCGQLSIFVQLL